MAIRATYGVTANRNEPKPILAKHTEALAESLREFATKLWSDASELRGRAGEDGWRISHAGNGAKGIIVRAPAPRNLLQYTYYPKPEHAATFGLGILGVRPGGPAQIMPGCVGMAEVSDAGGLRHIDFLQASHKQGAPADITRALATKYGGWRQHVLDEIFKDAEGKAVMLAADSGEKNRNNAGIFREIAKRYGYKVKENPGYLMATPRRK